MYAFKYILANANRFVKYQSNDNNNRFYGS